MFVCVFLFFVLFFDKSNLLVEIAPSFSCNKDQISFMNEETSLILGWVFFCLFYIVSVYLFIF